MKKLNQYFVVVMFCVYLSICVCVLRFQKSQQNLYCGQLLTSCTVQTADRVYTKYTAWHQPQICMRFPNSFQIFVLVEQHEMWQVNGSIDRMFVALGVDLKLIYNNSTAQSFYQTLHNCSIHQSIVLLTSQVFYHTLHNCFKTHLKLFCHTLHKCSSTHFTIVSTHTSHLF